MLQMQTQLQEQLGITSDSNPRALHQTSLNEMKAATTQLNETFRSIETLFGEIIAKTLRVEELKVELEDLKTQQQTMEMLEAKVGVNS